MSRTVATRHPIAGKVAPRIDAARYDAMKAALLAVVPRGGEGVAFASLPKLIAGRLPADTFRAASVPWYVVVVKLDLEARGLIRRVPGRGPQRLVRARTPRPHPAGAARGGARALPPIRRRRP